MLTITHFHIVANQFKIVCSSQIMPNQKTLANSLGHVFGHGLECFSPGITPSEGDVIKRWICLYDKTRGDKFKLSPIIRQGLILRLTDEILNQWYGKTVQPKTRVSQMVRALIGRAEDLRRFTRRVNDEFWIKDQQRIFSGTFDISYLPKSAEEADLFSSSEVS